MKTILTTALVIVLQGCAGFVTMATPNDAPPAVQATALVADTAILYRAWQLLGVFK